MLFQTAYSDRETITRIDAVPNVGDQVTVEGRMVTSETCGPGPTIQVGRVVPVRITRSYRNSQLGELVTV